MVETFDDLAAAIFANLHRECVAGLVKGPAVQTIQQMQNRRVLIEPLSKGELKRVVLQVPQLFRPELMPPQRQFYRFGDNRTRSDLGVVEVDPDPELAAPLDPRRSTPRFSRFMTSRPFSTTKASKIRAS